MLRVISVPALADSSLAYPLPWPSSVTVIVYFVSSSNTAWISTLLAGIVNLLSVIVMPPLTTFHSLNLYPLFGELVRVIVVPSVADEGSASAVPLPSSFTVTV